MAETTHSTSANPVYTLLTRGSGLPAERVVVRIIAAVGVIALGLSLWSLWVIVTVWPDGSLPAIDAASLASALLAAALIATGWIGRRRVERFFGALSRRPALPDEQSEN